MTEYYIDYDNYIWKLIDNRWYIQTKNKDWARFIREYSPPESLVKLNEIDKILYNIED